MKRTGCCPTLAPARTPRKRTSPCVKCCSTANWYSANRRTACSPAKSTAWIAFALRYRARKFQSEQYRMPWSGLRGQRTSLIPHQLHIAHDVGRRHAPRVLLADEVGLGKTIEAGMILHQQLLSGAAERVLDRGPGNPPAPVAGGDAAPFQPAFLAVRRRALRRSAARCLQSVRNRTAGDLLFGLRASQQAAPGAPCATPNGT